ncbi:PIN domain-containing protein [Candidatus Woesearchaeota archaeon]|nr:PIN domain-containing protein [Candidatus Woesearchaeota archaeon]
MLVRERAKSCRQIAHLILTRCFLIPIEPETALNAARINSKKKIGLGDSLILACAKAHNLKLVTGDPHFKKEKQVTYLGS